MSAHPITISADQTRLTFGPCVATVSLPPGARIGRVGESLRLSVAPSHGGPAVFTFSGAPRGLLTIETASWLCPRWVSPEGGDPVHLPTPAVLAWDEGALAICGECDFQAEELEVRARGQVAEITVPPEDHGALWLGAGDVHGALEALAAAMMVDIEGRVAPGGPLGGWMSWDELRAGVTESDVIEHARLIAQRLGKGAAIIQLDDGWQRAAGDWEPHEAFAHGLRWLTEGIHRLGLRAGLWIAPFLVALRSPLGRAHPDWLLRGGDGAPLIELDQPHWGGRVGTLDPTRPEVRDWLRALGDRIRGWGFDYVKMDFLAHALTGKAADESRPRAPSYREAIRALAAGLGPHVVTMGCGTPLLAGRGLFHAARISSDAVTDWATLRDCLTSAAARHALHRRWWRNDPDNAVLRPPLTLGQARLWASTVAVSGGSTFLGDDLRRLPEDRWDIACKIWPPLDPASRPLGLGAPLGRPASPLGDGWITEIHRPWGRWWVVMLSNGGAEPRLRRVTWADLNLDPGAACHIWEFWSAAHLGIHRGELSREIEPESCEVCAITPALDHPQIVGADRHVVVGALDPVAVRWLPEEGRLTGEIGASLPHRAAQLSVFAPSPWQLVRAEGVEIADQRLAGGGTLITLRREGDGAFALTFERPR